MYQVHRSTWNNGCHVIDWCGDWLTMVDCLQNMVEHNTFTIRERIPLIPQHTPQFEDMPFLQYRIVLDVCSVIVQHSVLEWIFWNRFIKSLYLIKFKLRIGQPGNFMYLQWLWLFLHYDVVIHSMRIGHQQTILLISQVLVLLYTKQWTLVITMPSGSCRQAWSFSSRLLFYSVSSRWHTKPKTLFCTGMQWKSIYLYRLWALKTVIQLHPTNLLSAKYFMCPYVHLFAIFSEQITSDKKTF